MIKSQFTQTKSAKWPPSILSLLKEIQEEEEHKLVRQKFKKPSK